MYNRDAAGPRSWLAIEASQEGVLRFAVSMPAARPRVASMREVNIQGVPTFTDALQQFERESGVRLRDVDCVMAIAGAAAGETLSLVRSRWTITRSGLAAVFGKPVTIINDVGARAWAINSGTAITETVRGTGLPNLATPGRYIMIMVEEGVGAAIIDIDRDGVIRVLETEAGHMDFAPVSEREEVLAKALRGISPYTSWEKLLMLERQDAVWATACPQLAEIERMRMLSAILGRFSVNLMNGYGAWNGVLITGSRAGRLLDATNRSAFETSFGGRRNFSRLISSAPVWRVDQREAVLTGATERLAQSFRLELRDAA